MYGLNITYWENHKDRLYKIYTQYLQGKKRKRKKSIDKNLIITIIEIIPSAKVLHEIIFSRKFSLLIQHEALIKAIQKNYQFIVEKVILEYVHRELVRTAINHVTNHEVLLSFLQTYRYKFNTPLNSLFKQVILQIDNHQYLVKTIRKVLTSAQTLEIFREIECRSHVSRMPAFYLKMIPILIEIFPCDIVQQEFKQRKYSPKIRQLIASKCVD